MAKRKRSGNGKSRSKRRRRRSTVTIGSHRRSGTVMKVGKNVGSADRMMVKLVYCDVWVLSTAAGSTETIVWRANSIEDPQYAVGGHQPRFHDQWAAFYIRYHVMACKIVCRVVAHTLNNVCRVYLISSDNPNSPSANDYCEHMGVRKAVITANKNNATLSSYRSSRSVLGPLRTGQTSSGADFGSNPVDEWYWKFGLHNEHASTAAGIKVEFTLTFYCKFSERKQPSTS